LSRNKDRVGGSHTTSADPAPQASSPEATFSFIVPTEYVDLPSKGAFYPSDHPLHGQDSIEIKQMTAKEEDILTSRTLLKKGVALDRVIQSVIIDKNIDTDSLLVGDRNAIIIATRVSGYGSEYNTSVTCPACGDNQNFSFDLNSAASISNEPFEHEDLVNNDDGTFDLSLPRTQLNIRFKLLTGVDERRLIKGFTTSSKNKKNEEESNITDQLRNIIVSVNNNTTTEAIDYVVENLPSADSRHLRNVYRQAAPALNLSQGFTCAECEHEQELEVPLSADFFWPDQ